MTKYSGYDPEKLAQRLQEIESGTGEPYQRGEDPAVDSAMRLQNANHPHMSPEAMQAIGASLLLGASASLNPPKLNNQAFDEIGAKLQAQMQLQSAPKPEMSEEALNRIDAALQMKNAPIPALSDAALLRIEKRLLNTLKPPISFFSMTAALLILLGFALTFTTYLPQIWTNTTVATEPQISEVETTPEIVDTTIEETAEVKPPNTYTSGVAVAALVTDTPEPTPEPTVESSQAVVATDEPSATPTMISMVDVLQLPATVIIDGPIEALDEDSITIFNLIFVYDYDPTLLDNYEVGDMVHIKGAENPYEDDNYLIIHIEPVYVANTNLNTDIASSVSINPPEVPTGDDNASDDTTDITSVIASSNTDISQAIITGSITVDNSDTGTQPDDDCGDGSDANLGQGQECNQGQANGSATGNANSGSATGRGSGN